MMILKKQTRSWTEYDAFLSGVIGALSMCVLMYMPGTETKNGLLASLRDLADRLCARIDASLLVSIQFALDASRDRLTPEDLAALEDHLLGLRNDAIEGIRDCAQRDIARAMSRYREFSFSVMAGSKGVSKSILDAREKFSRTQVSFIQQNAAGRRYESAKFVELVKRQAEVWIAVESELFCIAKNHGDLAVSVHGGSQAPERGAVFSISGSGTHASYEDVKSTLFHPNSNAWVAPQ